ncbi:MAG TPA: hypothetical protein VGJ70_12685, partial [Solirubrobacteraceae bacterium]
MGSDMWERRTSPRDDEFRQRSRSKRQRVNDKEHAMGRIVVTEFVSLDGVMQAPGGGEEFKHAGWTFEIDRGPEGNKFKLDETMATAALLLGRRT